jgi:hypothetical protein
MVEMSEEAAIAIGVGIVVTGAFVWWVDSAGRPLGVPSAYAAAFGIGIGLAIVLQAVRARLNEE